MLRKRILVPGIMLVAGVVVLLFNFRAATFYLGGFFLHTGYVIQDWAQGFHDKIADETAPHPYEVFRKIIDLNQEQATAWRFSPKVTDRKPKALLVMCIDPRLDDNRILGDTRGYYDIIRIPGSVITPEVAEAVELAVVKHDVKLVMVATHTDCAMEKLAQSHAGQEHYPLLSRGINDHSKRLHELSQRAAIKKKIHAHDLWVIEKRIDTVTGKFL